MNNQKNRIRTCFSSGLAGWMLLFVGLWLFPVSGWSQTQGQELTGKAREKNIERIEKQLKDFYEAWLGACVDEDPAFIEAIGESYVAPNGVFKPDFGKFPEDGLWSFSNYCTNFRMLYQSMYEEPLEFRQSNFRFIYLKSVDGGNSVEADFTFQSKLYSGERLITSAEVEAVMLIDAYSPTNYKLRQIAPTQPVTVHYSPEEKKQTPKAEVPVAVETPKEERTPVVEMPMEETTPSFTSTVSAKEETFTVNGVSFTMVRVEGGTFRMGATSEQQKPRDNEKPVHSVTLSSYSIGQTEVTQALWKAVMGSNPSYFKGDNLPVENVSWNDCRTFIRKLNALTGRTFRFPTEAEWEFAARGGNESQGYQYSGSNNLGSVAWYWDNAGKKTHPVATKSANELGLYDMSGNVWEWCQDWKGSYSSSSQTNPTGPSSGSGRVNRGGSWSNDAWSWRVADRGHNGPSLSINDLGLRLALPDSSPVETPTVVTSASKLEGVINGHEYVDLGLSVKWATCNVGASKPSDYGDYFAWGETRPKSEYTKENSVTYKKKIRNIGGKVQYDAARANWGGSWRLPTIDEIKELKSKCKWTWATQGGHNGYKVVGPSGKSIFLPAAGWRYGTSLYGVGEYGYYWSSTPYEGDTHYAYYLGFLSSRYDWDWISRNNCLSVRPVSD